MNILYLEQIIYILSDFISKSKGEFNDSTFSDFNLPKFLQDYLKSSENYIDELTQFSNFVNNKPHKFLETRLHEVIANFTIEKIPKLVAALPVNFSILTDSEKKSQIDKLKLNSSLNDFLIVLLGSKTSFEIYEFVEQTLEFLEFKYTLVRLELASDVDSSTKLDMFKTLFARDSKSLIKFQVNRKIVGGIRIINNSKMIDLSWTQKITNLLKIKS